MEDFMSVSDAELAGEDAGSDKPAVKIDREAGLKKKLGELQGEWNLARTVPQRKQIMNEFTKLLHPGWTIGVARKQLLGFSEQDVEDIAIKGFSTWANKAITDPSQLSVQYSVTVKYPKGGKRNILQNIVKCINNTAITFRRDAYSDTEKTNPVSIHAPVMNDEGESDFQHGDVDFYGHAKYDPSEQAMAGEDPDVRQDYIRKLVKALKSNPDLRDEYILFNAIEQVGNDTNKLGKYLRWTKKRVETVNGNLRYYVKHRLFSTVESHFRAYSVTFYKGR
jgi:hypothetical protein